MYSAHFGLHTHPFFPLSDPEAIFRSSQVRETVGHFFYARENHHALFLLTGEVGTGKTTALRAVQRELPPETPFALVHHATSTPKQLLDELCLEFALPRQPRESKLERHRRLESAFIEWNETRGKPVLVLDEAHLLPDAVLESVRLLTNLRHGSHPALQVCLAGQPELVRRLRSRRLRQLRQRITLRYTMQPLGAVETELYLIERMRAAGSSAPNRIFDSQAVRAIHELTAGIPREINVVADQAMMSAYLESSRVVRRQNVRSVEREFGFEGVAFHRPEATVDSDAFPDPLLSDTATVRARDLGTSFLAPKTTTRTEAEGGAAKAGLARALRLARTRPAALRIGLAFCVAGTVLALGTARLPDPAIVPAGSELDGAADRLEAEDGRDAPEAAIATATATAAAAEAEPAPEPEAPANVPVPRASAGSDGGLAERYPSALEIESRLPGVVWLGQRKLGLAPGRFSPVPSGRHELTLDVGDGRVFSKSVIITPGSTTYVRASEFSP